MKAIKDFLSLVVSMINWRLVIAVLAVIIIGGYGFLWAKSHNFFLDWFKTTEIVEIREPKGTLYVSMAKYSDPVSIMSLDLSASVEQGFQSYIKNSSASSLQLHKSKDIDNLPVDYYVSSVSNDDGIEVYTDIFAKYQDDILESFLPNRHNLTQIRHLSYPLNSEWLLFSAKNKETFAAAANSGEILSVESRGIYITNPVEEKTYRMAAGSSPAFSPTSNSILYLGADGLKQIYLDRSGDPMVNINFGSEGTAFGENMNLAVSEDGTKIAITSPNQSALFVGDITSWDPVKIENVYYADQPEEGAFPKAYYWPVFSPDGEFLAVQVTDFVTNDREENPRIEIVDLTTDTVVRSISLEGYDFSRAFIDEWDY